MPWKVYKETGRYCLYKKNADGSKGDKVPGGCHETADEARKHQAALYVNVEEALLEADTEIVEAETGMDDDECPEGEDCMEVTPEQAEKIDLARNIGTLSLILRNQVDTVDAATEGIRQQDLFAAATPPPVAASAPAPVKKVVRRAPAKPVAAKPVDESSGRVEVIRGLQKATADF